MRELLELARRPIVWIGPDATATELASLLLKERIGAAVVLVDGALVGIVSERDVVGRVVAERRDADATRVGDIMTTQVRTARAGMKIADALDVMSAGRFRHLPLVDESGAVVGMLSIRDLLKWRVVDLDLKNVDLMTYLAADGAGG